MKFARSILLISLLLTILCTSVKSSENEKVEGEIIDAQICEPNEKKLKECNRCKCAPNGRRWLCTRKMCPSIPTSATAKHVSPVELKSHECTPGVQFKKDCNWCICTSTGIGVCTLRGCRVERPRISFNNDNAIRARRQVKEEKVYTLEEVQSPSFTCTPSYSFKLDCNTCWCAADGKRPRYCTRIACLANVYSTLPPPTTSTTARQLLLPKSPSSADEKFKLP